MSPRAVAAFAVSLLLAALAAGARGDGSPVYRWVGRDGRTYTSNAPPPRGVAQSDAAAAATCSRYSDFVEQWRSAHDSVQSWQQALDRIQSRTDDFLRRNETTYTRSLGRAHALLDEARDRASRIATDARAAGMPPSCLSE